MQSVYRLPHPALGSYVHSYWEIAHALPADASLTVPFGCTGRAHVVISLQTQYQSYYQAGQPMPVSGVTLFCQVSRPYTTHLYGPTRGIVIQFTATGLHALWALPVQHLSGHSHDLLSVMPAGLPQLIEQLHEATSSEDRFKQLDAFLLRRLVHVRPTDNRVDAAVRLIEQRPGFSLQQVARYLNCSERTLRRRFTEQVGHSAKYHARIQRFLKTWRCLNQDAEPDWTNLLHTGGYYDQAHFINEFRHFNGQSPQRYVTNRTGAHDMLRQV